MIFPDFSSLFKIHGLFPHSKMPSHFSPNGNPVFYSLPVPRIKMESNDCLWNFCGTFSALHFSPSREVLDPTLNERDKCQLIWCQFIHLSSGESANEVTHCKRILYQSPNISIQPEPVKECLHVMKCSPSFPPIKMGAMQQMRMFTLK